MFLCLDFCLPRVLTLNDLPWKLPSQHLCPENVQIFSMLIFSFVFHSFLKEFFIVVPKDNVSTNQCEHNIPTYIKTSFGSSPSAAYHHVSQRWENWLRAFSSLTNPLFSDCYLRPSPRERRIFSNLQYVSWDVLQNIFNQCPGAKNHCLGDGHWVENVAQGVKFPLLLCKFHTTSQEVDREQ